MKSLKELDVFNLEEMTKSPLQIIRYYTIRASCCFRMQDTRWFQLNVIKIFLNSKSSLAVEMYNQRGDKNSVPWVCSVGGWKVNFQEYFNLDPELMRTWWTKWPFSPLWYNTEDRYRVSAKWGWQALKDVYTL